jgi:hypothetical protein
MLEAWTKGSKVPFQPSNPRYPLHGRRNTPSIRVFILIENDIFSRYSGALKLIGIVITSSYTPM